MSAKTKQYLILAAVLVVGIIAGVLIGKNKWVAEKVSGGSDGTLRSLTTPEAKAADAVQTGAKSA